MSRLEELFTRFGTDKGTWGYSPAYEKHLNRDRVRNVLEIGICGFREIPNNVVGASLFAWRDYLPHAEIYGVDNDARFIFNDQHRIHTALCDAYDATQLAPVLLNWGKKFDFICDDAVHDPSNQMRLVCSLWPMLAPGGVYAIEEACPYKVPDGDLGAHMVVPLMKVFDDMHAVEYSTHKPERLLILEKRL